MVDISTVQIVLGYRLTLKDKNGHCWLMRREYLHLDVTVCPSVTDSVATLFKLVYPFQDERIATIIDRHTAAKALQQISTVRP